MFRTPLAALCAGLLAALLGTPAMAADPPQASSKDAPAAASAELSPAISHDAENAVVKVFSTMRYPDFFRPWNKQAPAEASGSGVVIEGKRILTNAHVVLYASQIQVQGNQAGDKIAATVVAISPDIDLAVLKLDDPSFFDTRPPLPRASQLPQIKDPVLAYGFPTGGNSLSITKGIVSRIEFVGYSFSTSGLRIQIDAAINAGNSGGPAIAGDKMIGLAFSRLGNAQNIGYIIPNEEIELFLKGIANGHYGKPAMYDELQTLENPALRAYLKVDAATSGMIVHRPFIATPTYPLKEWDLITKIADTPIDDQGMIKLGSTLRVSFQYLIQKTASNGRVPLTIVRAGKTMQVQLPVTTQRPLLLPDLRGEYPSYFIYGPLVFSRASQQLSQVMANSSELASVLSFIHSPLITGRADEPDKDHEDLAVIASPLFPHKLSKGYSNPSGGVIYSVNGTRVRSLTHLVSLLRDMKEEFVTFELDQRGGEAMVFPRKEMAAATEEILTDNDVRAQGSPDLMKIWQAKP
jgi:S1-C subfamily serine protease